MISPTNDSELLLADPAPLYPFPSPDEVLQAGESGTVIFILQAVLQELCSDFTFPKAPAMSGQYDNATAACVTSWQRITGMPQNGQVDRLFWDMLATMYNARLL